MNEIDNSPNLRKVERQIGSVVIISNDGKLLMGRKRSGRDSSFDDSWHIFGEELSLERVW